MNLTRFRWIRSFLRALPAWLWLAVLATVLHVLFFLPASLLSMDAALAFPWELPAAEEGQPAWWLSRANPDTFRIWGEAWLLGMISLLTKGKRIWWPLLVALVMPVLLLFQWYDVVSFHFYGQQPYLLNDLTLLQEVLPLFMGQVSGGGSGVMWLAGAGVLFVFGLIASLAWDWSLALSRLPGKRIFLAGWVLLGLTLSWLSWQGRELETPLHQHTARWVGQSLSRSLQPPSGSVVAQLPEGIDTYRSYFDKQLISKPDVYWIFFESYGKVLAEDPEMKEAYRLHQDSLAAVWRERGWQSASIYSNAPVKGGRSWLAFTSALAGIRLDNHLVYNDLVEKFYDYPHIIRWFKTQGYTTTRVKTMNKQEASTPRNLLLAERFYGFDQWFQYDSIPYRGFKYDVFGGIPDQYGLGYAVEQTRLRREDPMFLFMITMSGHQPWFPPAPVLEDWHELDSIHEDPRAIPLDSAARANLYFFYEARLRGSSRQRYFDAVKYQFEMIDAFLRNEADSNSVFVLIGDHQPPELGMDWRYNFSTPVHVVTRDSSFLRQWTDQGFEPGLFASSGSQKPIQHEAMFSLFVSQMLRRYGQGQPEVPWIPDGLLIPDVNPQ